MDTGGIRVDSWTMCENAFLARPDSRNTVEVLFREGCESIADLRQFQIQPLPTQRPSTSTETETAAATSSTVTSEVNQQTVCVLHWEDEPTADRLSQTLGGNCCRKIAFNNVFWENPSSFTSLYILVNDQVADKFSKERIFDTLQWIDEFAALGRPIHAVRCTDNENSFNKTFYRLPESPQIYEWPKVSEDAENNLNNSNVQIGFTNNCILEKDENGCTMITQFASSTNILAVSIGDTSSENSTKIVLTTMNDVPGMDKKLFTVYKDNRCMINTYLPTKAGATVMSVERGSVILNLKLDQGITLEEFLKVRLKKILNGCLRDDLLSQVGDKFRLDVKVHSKLTVDMLGNLSADVKKEMEHELIQTNITWVGTNPKFLRNGQPGSNASESVTSKPSAISVSSTEVQPADDVQPVKAADTTSKTMDDSDSITSIENRSVQTKVVGKDISSHEKKTSLKFSEDPDPENSGSLSLGLSAPLKSQQTSQLSQEMSRKRKAITKYDTDESMAKLLNSPHSQSESRSCGEVSLDQGSTYAPKKLKSCRMLFKGQLSYFERPKTKVSGYFKIAERRDFDDEVFFDTLFVGRSEDVSRSLDELMISNSDPSNLDHSTIEGYIAAKADEEREKKIMVFWVDKHKHRHQCKGKSMLDCMKEYCGRHPEYNSREEVWSEEEDPSPVKNIFPSPKKQTLLSDVMSKKVMVKQEPLEGGTSESKKMKIV